jgi:hypothetical protein
VRNHVAHLVSDDGRYELVSGSTSRIVTMCLFNDVGRKLATKVVKIRTAIAVVSDQGSGLTSYDPVISWHVAFIPQRAHASDILSVRKQPQCERSDRAQCCEWPLLGLVTHSSFRLAVRQLSGAERL